jgi:hypothetical protein
MLYVHRLGDIIARMANWAEARSASRSKMRGARPRRARDGWEGSPGAMVVVGQASLIIDPFILLGVEGGLKGTGVLRKA